jgi:rfaE bifunctional protein nucleotidyltransferase chain/domain
MFTHLKEKLKTFEKIQPILDNLRKQGKTIVTLNGSFDLIHSGHIYMFQEAKKQGDILILGLNSDKSYKEYKDKRGPLISEKHRAAMLAALADIDYIVLFDETTPIRFLKTVKPDVHCNGSEYGKDCIESETLKHINTRLHVIPELHSEEDRFSTTNLIDTIIERFKKPKIKAVFLDRDGILNVDSGYVFKTEEFQFVEGIIDVLLYLKELGYKFFITTNQSAIATGKYTIEDMEKFNVHLIKEFKKHNIEFEHIYYCPHHPSVEPCDCRKPGFVMWQRAKKEYNVDMKNSWSIGDKITDVIAGKKAGTKTILVQSRYVKEGHKTDSHVDFFVDSVKDIFSIKNLQ